MLLCQHQLHQTMRLNSSTLIDISATLTSLVLLPMGLELSVDFYNKDYLASHPDIVVEKKVKSPDEDKSLADSKALLPTLKDFKTRNPNIKPSIFLGDAAFDTIEIYKSLFEDFNFQKAFIPLKVKLSMDNVKYTFNENGIPCCPHDSSLPMKREGSKSHLRSKLSTMKFVCPSEFRNYL